MAADVDKLAADIREVNGNNTLGAGALAEALIAKGWRAPKKATAYREIGTAENVEVGQLVRSRFSGSGAVWRVIEVGPAANQWGRKSRILKVVSLSSNRTDTRYTGDMVIVAPTA